MTDPLVRGLSSVFDKPMNCGCKWPICTCEFCPECHTAIRHEDLDAGRDYIGEFFVFVCPHCQQELEITVEYDPKFYLEKSDDEG